MGKGSGTCQRPGISLEAGDSVKAESELHNEIGTTLELQRVKCRWWTKDERVSYQKREEGWVVDAYSDPLWKAFREYGVISSIKGDHTCFPSLKAARQAVDDVSLEVGLNIDPRLTKGKYVSYKIKDLPLSIKRDEGLWWVACRPLVLSQSLQKYFNSTQEFRDAWYATSPVPHYPTRKAAHQAVTNWLAQTVSKSNTLNKA